MASRGLPERPRSKKSFGMKVAFPLAALFLASAGFASEILPEHSGHFRCRCLHDGCKESSLTDVKLVLDQAGNRLAIDYGNEIQSGAPARTTFSDGAVTYTLPSRGNVSFTGSGEMKFGWGKLWTCRRLP